MVRRQRLQFMIPEPAKVCTVEFWKGGRVSEIA